MVTALSPFFWWFEFRLCYRTFATCSAVSQFNAPRLGRCYCGILHSSVKGTMPSSKGETEPRWGLRKILVFVAFTGTGIACGNGVLGMDTFILQSLGTGYFYFAEFGYRILLFC